MATFLRGIYYGDTWFSKIPKDIFMDNYKKVVEALVDSPNTLVNIACLTEDEDVILGYSILSIDFQTLHYLYVKSAWRKQGIAKRLSPSSPAFVTHLTAQGASLLPKLNGAVFNPFKT